MKRLLLLACAAIMLTAGAAVAAPGDFVTISGTVQQERGDRLVVRGDDGFTYLANLRGATPGQFRVGDPIRIAGYAGRQANQIDVAIVEATFRTGPAGRDGGVGRDDALVIEGWRLPQSHAYQAQDGRGVYHQIRPRDIPGTIAQGKEVYDLTAQAWVNHPTAYASTGGRNPAYTASAFDRSGRGWDQVRGRVERVDRQSLMLRTDDGRRMFVDTSDARLATRPDRGARVVALGYATGADRFDARYIGEERRRR